MPKYQLHNDFCYMDSCGAKLLDKVNHVSPVVGIPFCTPHKPNVLDCSLK